MFVRLRAFLSNLSNAKNPFFLAFLTQKLAPSHVLNGIIFVIDEQCNLIFETALFTNCKPYIIFLFSGTHWGEIEGRERQKRGEIKNYWKIIKKHYLNEMVKKIEVLILGVL